MDAVTIVLAKRARLEPSIKLATLYSLGFHSVAIAALMLSMWWAHSQPRPNPPRSISVSIGALPGGGGAEAATKPEVRKKPRKPAPVPRQHFDPKAAVKNPDKLAAPSPKARKDAPAPPPPSTPVPELAETPQRPQAPDGGGEGTGNGEGPGVPGAVPGAAGGPTFDVAFEYPRYVDQMLRSIEREWYKPQADAGTAATVYFRISRSGHISIVEIEKSSGLSFYNRSALRAVQNASPFAPLPADFDEPSLGIHLTFR